jgi:L-fuculose-phosphate aldolase
MRNREVRESIIDAMKTLSDRGLNRGRSGNASVRYGNGYLITPTGIEPAQLDSEQIVELKDDGRMRRGQLKPSSEWRFHRDIYRARSDVGAVVHVHSDFATALACARRAIPAFHYMVAVAGGDSIPCTGYANYGSQELSDKVVAMLEARDACLMANHGMIAVASQLKGALDLAIEVEALAKQYCLSLQVGGPVLLTQDEIEAVLEKFAEYGQQTSRRRSSG